MNRWKLTYELRIFFSEPVSSHSYSLRCFPGIRKTQDIRSCICRITPCSGPQGRDRDSFGNSVLYGRIEEGCREFRVLVEAETAVREGPEPEPSAWQKLGMYRYLAGIVDIYPAVNPLGIDSITRGIPAFDLDMNRVFPGNRNGSMTEYVAARLMEDLSGSDLCIDIHASNIFLTEIPQVRINELHRDRLVPMAEGLNVDLIWIHGNSTVLESTLAYSLNSTGTPTLVVEMGVGMRITKAYCDQLTDGIFYVMKNMGMWSGPAKEVRKPLIAAGADPVSFLNAPVSGVFLSQAKHGDSLRKGDPVGLIVDPLEGTIRERLKAPADGILFTIREYPVVNEGSLIARILKKEADERA